MGNKTTIKDFYGKILGSVEEEPNGDKVAKDFYGRILGTFKKANNHTQDFYGRILGTGDLTSALIWKNNI